MYRKFDIGFANTNNYFSGIKGVVKYFNRNWGSLTRYRSELFLIETRKEAVVQDLNGRLKSLMMDLKRRIDKLEEASHMKEILKAMTRNMKSA